MNHPDNTITFGSEAQDSGWELERWNWLRFDWLAHPYSEFGILSPEASSHPAG